MTLEAMILMPSSTDGAASDIYNASAKDVYFPDYADDLGTSFQQLPFQQPFQQPQLYQP